MKRLTLLAFFAAIFALLPYSAFCNNAETVEKLISILNLKPTETTPANISGVLGKPDQIDRSGRQNVWHYTNGSSNLSIYWDGKVIKLQKLIFSAVTSTERIIFDNKMAKQLKSGETAVVDVIKTFGVPKDLEMKGISQELHYVFKENKLDLFFRNGTLVNYTLF